VLFSEQAATDASGTEAKKKSAHPQQRAVLEAAVCTSVMHTNVVTTYHYDITPVNNVNAQVGLGGMTIDQGANTDWKLYLVQEYCNASLQDALRNKLLVKQETKTPDLDLILSVLMDIARGMIYIHSKNIIHGDLTPGNVLLKQEASSPIGVVGKITDFGVSRPSYDPSYLNSTFPSPSSSFPCRSVHNH
jgi:serine/threonine protein kinase